MAYLLSLWSLVGVVIDMFKSSVSNESRLGFKAKAEMFVRLSGKRLTYYDWMHNTLQGLTLYRLRVINVCLKYS